ncbi:MAG: DUF47 family protein [Bryobacteraceae bacterium]|nr:DUF47 family protein [Bryobacteraceae bacterium]
MRFLPREEKFFHYFLDQVRIISEASQLLLDGATTGKPTLADAALEIAKLEKRGDELIHEVFRRLNQTFITPLDPEDIHTLSSHLDDVLDGIEETVHRIVAYRAEPLPPDAVELCQIIRSCTRALVSAFEALNKNEPLLDFCLEIGRLEDEADRLVRSSVSDLFNSKADPIYILKLKEIYESLEETTDRCEDVADALQNVVVKNS